MSADERNWGAEPWRQPTLAEGDALVYSECGRIIGKTDYRSHWLCLVKQQYGGYAIRVKHGGGEERIVLGYEYRVKPVADGLALMDADARYLTLYALFMAHSNAVRETEGQYRSAFVQGRLKKKRLRGCYAVWIEPAAEVAHG